MEYGGLLTGWLKNEMGGQDKRVCGETLHQEQVGH